MAPGTIETKKTYYTRDRSVLSIIRRSSTGNTVALSSTMRKNKTVEIVDRERTKMELAKLQRRNAFLKTKIAALTMDNPTSVCAFASTCSLSALTSTSSSSEDDSSAGETSSDESSSEESITIEGEHNEENIVEPKDANVVAEERREMLRPRRSGWFQFASCWGTKDLIRLEAEWAHRLRLLRHEKDEEIYQLERKVSCRDDVISDLEDATSFQEDTIRTLQSELNLMSARAKILVARQKERAQIKSAEESEKCASSQ